MKTLENRLVDSLVSDPSTISAAIDAGAYDDAGFLDYWPHLNVNQRMLVGTVAQLEGRSPNEIVDSVLREVLRAYKIVHGLQSIPARQRAVH